MYNVKVADLISKTKHEGLYWDPRRHILYAKAQDQPALHKREHENLKQDLPIITIFSLPRYSKQ